LQHKTEVKFLFFDIELHYRVRIQQKYLTMHHMKWLRILPRLQYLLANVLFVKIIQFYKVMKSLRL